MIKKMTEEAYRAAPGVNKSTLWEMRKSPAHYKYALEHPGKDTPALKLGRAIHAAILTPDEFLKHYVLAPDVDRRTKAGKELFDQFMQTHPGQELLARDDYETITAMHEAIWDDPDAANLLDGCNPERSMFWTDDATRIRCKCRLDGYKILTGPNGHAVSGVVIDLKTCADASTNAFMRDALRYGYDVQTAHYLRGFKAHFDVPTEWWFVAIEKTPPYAINLIKATDDFIDRGTWQLIDLMDELKECRKKRKWPGYGKNELTIPEWALIPDGGD